MFKKLLKSIKSFFITPRLNQIHLTLEGAFPVMGNQEAERKERNDLALAKANLELQRDALQKNLTLLHRTMLVAIFSALLALILGIISLVSKPNVTVRVYEQKAVQQTH